MSRTMVKPDASIWMPLDAAWIARNAVDSCT
jgi:hypothetical protein